MTIVAVFLYLVTQLWGRGITFAQLTPLSVLILIQVMGGGVIWILVSSRFRISQIEFLGMGLAIGSILSAVIDQVLLNLGARGFGGPLILLVAVCWISIRQRWKGILLTRSEHMTVFFILLACQVSLAIDEAFSTPGAIVLCVGFAFLNHGSHKRIHSSGPIVFTLLAGFSTKVYLLVFGGSGPLGPLFLTASDDQIKSEQLSYSIARWGLSSNSAAMSLPINFHWLSLGWSGGLMQLGDIDPFTVTLHIVPIVAFIAIASLLVAIATEIGLARWLILAAPALLLWAANADGDFRFFFVLTTTNLVPHIWILALVMVLAVFGTSKNTRLLVLIPILGTAVLLGKGPYGVVVAGGLLVALAISLKSCNLRSRSIDYKFQIALAASLIGSGVAYLVFLRSPLTDSYYFSLSEMIERFPFPLPVTSQGMGLRLMIGLIVFTIFVLTRFLWIFQIRSLVQSHLGRFIVGASITGALSFLVKQIGSETYFVNASLSVSIIGVLLFLSRKQPSLASISGAHAVALVVAVTVFLRITKLAVHDPRIIIGASLLGAAVCGFLLSRFTKIGLGLSLVVSLALIPISGGLSSIKFLQNEKIEFISPDEQAALAWVRENTPDSAIVVTDRYLCAGVIRCGTGMPVVASLTRRRLLIEGARTLTPTKMWDGPYPDQLQESVRLSLQLIESPSAKVLEELKQFGVTYAVVYGDRGNLRKLPGLIEKFRAVDVSVFKIANAGSTP